MKALITLILTILFFSYPVKSVFASSVLLNEIMAKPNGETEWVEIYNTTNQTIDLAGWTIKDANSVTSDDITLSGVLAAYQLKVFEKSKGWLNDTGDETVSLIDNLSTNIDSYFYNGTTAEKTFGRQPDGGSWTTNLNSTKNSPNGNISSTLSQNSPSPTPSPSPSVSLTPSPSTQPSASFSIINAPSKIKSDESFNIKVNLSLPNNPESIYYLKGAFKKSDGTRYFGLTKNNDWIEYADDYQDQLKIITDSGGNWSQNIEIKTDTNDKDYKGTGTYLFKVGRYTSGGSGPVWSNEVTLTITDVNALSAPSASPDTLTNDETTTQSSEDYDSQAILPDLSQDSSSIAGVSKEEEIKPALVKSERKINFIFLILGLSILGGGGFYLVKLYKNR